MKQAVASSAARPRDGRHLETGSMNGFRNVERASCRRVSGKSGKVGLFRANSGFSFTSGPKSRVIVLRSPDDLLDSMLGDHVPSARTPLDRDLRKVERPHQIPHPQGRLQVDQKHLRGTLLLGLMEGEIQHPAARSPLGEVILLVTSDAAELEALPRR